MDVLRFGVFELDPRVPELRRQGRRVHLQIMPLKVLEMLLEQPQELVPREAFFARLWPDDRSGILDDNLNTAIRKLRLALDDSAHHPRFIETVPKRGYRFIAPLTLAASAEAGVTAEPRPAAAVAALPETTATRRRRATRSAVAAAALTLLVLAAFLLLRGNDPAPEEPAADLTTVAVLPFVNAGGDPGDEYFSDGLTGELVDRLSRSESFRVVSRTSAFALKGIDIDAREIGRRLGAAVLVEGSVRRDGDRVRISAHLVDAGNGYRLWSESYDHRLDDVFAVQEDIALSIAGTLAGRLLAPSEKEALAFPAIDPIAYDLYLQGRFYWHRRNESGLRAAARHFEDAIERAPDYAPAWAGLADAYAVLGFYDYLPPAEAFPRARQAALRSLQLEPNNASAEATLGYATLYYDWNLTEAEQRFQRAIELDPGSSKAHQWYANLLTAAGRFDEAEREMRRAQQLEPLSLIASAALGWVRYHAKRYDDALEKLHLTLDLDADFELAYLWSGWTLEALGDYDEALIMLEQAVARSGGSGISSASLARLHALRGEREIAERVLADMQQAEGYIPAYEMAKAYFALRQIDTASQWLERAFEQRSHSLVFLRVDPQLSEWQQDPVVVRLVGRVQPTTERRASHQ